MGGGDWCRSPAGVAGGAARFLTVTFPGPRYAGGVKEVEVKAAVRDVPALRQALAAFGCTLSEPVRQEDILYAAEAKPITEFGLGDLVLRIRRQGDQAILTGKIPVTNHLDKHEAETVVSDPVAMTELLTWMDYQEIMRLAKERQKTTYGEYEICLDEVEGLGTFIEVEKIIDDRADSDAVQNELWTLLESLGIKEADRATKGYDQLLGEKAAV